MKTNFSDPLRPIDTQPFNPWQLPEDPFDYLTLVKQANGIGDVGNNVGNKVAIIGAGCCGLIAAHELMRIGLNPVVYEATGRIGGRTYTHRFEKDPKAFAEVGAMRIPITHELLFYYLHKWNIKYKPFPNPIIVDTMLYINGQKFFVPKGGELPEPVKQVLNKWSTLVDPIKAEMKKADSSPFERTVQWGYYVNKYKNKSLFEVLHEEGWTREETDLFGNVGIGTGGLDSLYQTCFLEMLRVVLHKDEENQQLIIGGTNQIADNFWSQEVDCVNWGRMSVERINGGKTRPAVKEINTSNDIRNKIAIKDVDGIVDEYDAVIITCSLRALELTIKINYPTFTDDVWTSLYDLHMVASQKLFVLTKTAFWKEQPDFKLYTTITDKATRQTYFFDASDFGQDTSSGVICLSYCWEDSAVKFSALTPEQRVELCLDVLEEIYGQKVRQMLSEQIIETFAWSWEKSHGYYGAYRMSYPGQYSHQWILYNQMKGKPLNNGVYLAGEALSWLGLSGWIEGALQTGLSASLSVIDRINAVSQ